MPTLPPTLQHLAALLDAQPGPQRTLLHYGLTLLMVEAGTATLLSTTPGEDGSLICTFRTVAGDVFHLSKPPLTTAEETTLRATVRQILEDDR
jgi:hypothetical protein